jgi:predicted metal-binding membrane protein
MHTDDGTQARTIEAIEQEMARQGVKNTEIARVLKMSAPQWSNVKSGHQVLAPWMLRKIAIRLGTAAPIVGEFVAATGEQVERVDTRPAVDLLGTSLSLVSESTEVAQALVSGVRTKEQRERALRELADVRAKLEALEAALMAGDRRVA